jgi:RNA polymerase sigma-70 factor (ECF subfamily)
LFGIVVVETETSGAPFSAEEFRRFQGGDPLMMESIVRLYQARLIGYARLYSRDRELAEDGAQEVFLSLWRQRTQVRSPEGIRLWLFVAMRRWIYRRSSSPGRPVEVSLEDDGHSPAEPSEAGGQAGGVLREQVRRILTAALNELHEQDRELVVLRFFGGLPLREIAETMNMPMGTVGVKLGRALEKLRTILERDGITMEDLLA